jgi:hypothetical protein
MAKTQEYKPNVPRAKWPLPKGRRVYFVSQECGQSPFEIQTGTINFYLRSTHDGHYFFNIRSTDGPTRLVDVDYVRSRNKEGYKDLLVKVAGAHEASAIHHAKVAAQHMAKAIKCVRSTQRKNEIAGIMSGVVGVADGFLKIRKTLE